VTAILYPLLLAIVMAGGYYLGTLQTNNSDTDHVQNASGLLKLNRVLDEIEVKYVDSIESDQLVETSIGGILQNLDPHSSYIPAKDLSYMDEPLKGSFGGIGIRFMILRDTLIVTNVVESGPSQRSGILAGDRIIGINDSAVTNIGLKNADVLDKLKGQIQTHVKVTVFRNSTNKTIPYDIIRGPVPIKSVESAQIISEGVGYIKLVRFAEPTPLEFDIAAKKLLNNGMKKLILDLRDNGGGYLQPAVQVVDQFLKNGKMIVYTEGRHNGRVNNYATSKGRLEKTELIILINENSASASEIVAGAIQDNDRGLIVGRQSFGKGLVQEPILLSDGSSIRLTVARYYTPSGRCIQKPYGKGIDYNADYLDRYENGEFYTIDSSKLEKLDKFETTGGRIVYGGGGIFPDIFIPLDTIGASSYFSALSYTASFTEFAFEFVDGNRNGLNDFRNAQDFDNTFVISENMFEDFVLYAEEQHQIKRSPYGLAASKERIKTRLKAQIAANVWGNNGMYTVYNKKDLTVIRAVQEIEQVRFLNR
jgi:carboxyl-terminal processing protease